MSELAIDPGALNRRLTLEAPVETADGTGGVIRSYATVATVWASVEPVAARGDVVAVQLGATVTHRITVRFMLAAFEPRPRSGKSIETTSSDDGASRRHHNMRRRGWPLVVPGDAASAERLGFRGN